MARRTRWRRPNTFLRLPAPSRSPPIRVQIRQHEMQPCRAASKTQRGWFMHLAGATPLVSIGETSPTGRELTAAILVVDDESAIVRASAYLLRRRGHEVDTADHGRLALTKLRT